MMKSFPVYKQLDQMDCGPTCLRMISRYYGKHYSLSRREDRLILWAGRLDEGKGLEFVLQAMPQVVAEFPDVKLVIAGNGSFERYFAYTRFIWPHIVFTGYLPREILHTCYSVAEIGILSSLNEQSSYVALEMMSHQLPIIASDIEGFKDVLQDGVSCLKTRVLTTAHGLSLDVTQLADHIKKLLSDTTLAHRLSRAARQEITTHFNSGDMFKKLLPVYEQVASEPVH